MFEEDRRFPNLQNGNREGAIMNFDYYIDEGVDRLFRYVPATGQQDRWDDIPGTWANVAPALVDNIYSGKVGLDEVTADRAEQDYPRAFEDRPIAVERTLNTLHVLIAARAPSEELIPSDEAETDPLKEFGERVFLTEDTMNRVLVAIALKISVEEVISVNQIPVREQAAVRNFYADLQKEISRTKLPPR